MVGVQRTAVHKTARKVCLHQPLFLAGMLVKFQQPRFTAPVLHHHQNVVLKRKVVHHIIRPGDPVVCQHAFTVFFTVVGQQKQVLVAFHVLFLSIVNVFPADFNQPVIAGDERAAQVYDFHCSTFSLQF